MRRIGRSQGIPQTRSVTARWLSPSPRVSLPPEIRLTVSARWAIAIGCSTWIGRTPVPTLMPGTSRSATARVTSRSGS